jgi:hypothetical protein
MCSSVAAIHPSPSSSASSSVYCMQEGEPSAPSFSEPSPSRDTVNSSHLKVKRSASESRLKCLLRPQEEDKSRMMRRASDSPKHYSGLIGSESTGTIETLTSSSTDLDSSSSTGNSTSSSILSSGTKKAQRRRSSVQFGSLTIRNYEVQLGDNPSCSKGVPVCIGWSYNELHPICIENYEAWMKDKRRSRNELHLPCSLRESILSEYGYSRSEMTQATREAAKIQKQRRASLKTTPITRLHESFIEMKMKRRMSC